MNISKHIQKKLNDKKFMQDITNGCVNENQVYERLGYYLSYCIATRSASFPVNVTTYPYPAAIATEAEYMKLPLKARQKNILQKGYVTHSFNGYSFDKVKKYGLGSSKIYDQKLSDDLTYLESIFGESKYYKNQGNTHSEIYYTAPGAKTFHYACGYSPERLWLGILQQERETALPIIIGETKSQYANRIIESKLNALTLPKEEEQKVLKAAKSVIEKLCTKKPVVALIPTNPKGCKLTCNHATTKNKSNLTLPELLTKDTGTYSPTNPETFFTENTHLIEFNNMGNLVSTNPIPAKNLTFFEVEDGFTITQNLALANGLALGDELDFFTGKQYSRPQSAKYQATPHTKTEIEKEM